MIYTMQDFITAQRLSQLARTVPVPIGYLWPSLFPKVSIRSTKFKFDKDTPRVIMAEFHARDAEVLPIPRRDVSFSEGTLGNIGAQRNMRTEEILEAALAGKLNEIEATDVEDLANAVNATIEYLAVNALFEGSVNIGNGYGITYTLDFGTHGVDTTPTVNWNLPATATPISDIIGWSDTIRSATGYLPSLYITSLKQVRNILAATDTKEQIWGWANSTGAVSLRQFNALISEVHGLPPIAIYDQTVFRVDTAADHSIDSMRMSDEDTFIGLAPSEVASTPGLSIMGITPEAAVAYSDVQKDLDSIAEGVWLDVITERVPSVRRKLRAKAATIPVFPTIGQSIRAVVQ